MDWFLYDRDLRHERVDKESVTELIRTYDILQIYFPKFSGWKM